MRQVKTLVTALTLVCIASVCLACLVAFMLWREAGRVLDQMQVRDRMRQTGPVSALYPAEEIIARALFRQASLSASDQAAQHIATLAFAESKEPHALQTLVMRRMAEEQLELEFSEPDLVHECLETTYYGSGEYGLDQASRSMFGKDPADLTEDEAFTLAAIAFQPLLRTDPDRLAQMAEKLKQRVK